MKPIFMSLSKRPPLSNRAVFVGLVLGSLGLALLPVLWPQLDLAVAAYFLEMDPARSPASTVWVDWVNEYTPDVFRILALSLVGIWLIMTLWRRPPPWTKRWCISLAFVGFSLLLGPGLVTWAVKEHQLRARPFDVVEFGGQRQFTPALKPTQQCEDNCAFFSGHVACGFFWCSLMLLAPRKRWFWIGGGIASGVLIGVARMSVGAHWLSDVLWALPITLATSWLVWNVLTNLYKHTPDDA